MAARRALGRHVPARSIRPPCNWSGPSARGQRTIVADPATGDSNYIAAQWTIPVACNGQMNYSGALSPPSSTSSIVPLAPAGMIPIAYDSQWSILNGVGRL